MKEKREERTKEMAEELSKLLQIHAHLAALEQMAASYAENHSTRLAIESGAGQGPHSRRGRHRDA